MDTAHQCFVKQGPVSNWAASTEGIWITMEHAPVPRAILDNAVKWNLTVNDLRNRKLFLCLYRPMLTCVNKTRFICIPQTKSRVCTRWLFFLLIFHPLSIWCCYLMASACSLTLIVLSISPMGKLFKVWVTRSEISAKVSCVICWSNRSRWNSRFLANLLDGDVLLVRQKRNVCLLLCTQSARKNPAWKMKFTNVHDWLLESRKTYKLIFLSSTPLLSLIFH